MAKGGYRGGMPGGMGGMGNMQQLMRQAQKMQADMQKAQEELEAAELTASSGGGMVTATVSGDRKLKSITIKPEAVDPDDVEMLEDLIVAAVSEAMQQAEDLAAQKMGKATGGMGSVPGLF